MHTFRLRFPVYLGLAFGLITACSINQNRLGNRTAQNQAAAVVHSPVSPDFLTPADVKWLSGTHSLSLPDWGPYSKNYVGISHVADSTEGLRFDLTVFPGFYRQKVLIPNVLFESGYHPWEATPDLHYFSFRHELEWKDQVYSDISFSRIDPQARLIRAHCVNNTAVPQNLVLHFMANLNFPDSNPLRIALPPDRTWINAVDYRNMQFAEARPQDNLTYDGFRKGEVRSGDYVGGSALGQGFGADKSDVVVYRLPLSTKLTNAVLAIRSRVKKGETATFRASGLLDREITLAGTGNFEWQVFPVGTQEKGNYEITLSSMDTAAAELDGLALLQAGEVNTIQLTRYENPIPKITAGPTRNSLILKYPGVNQYYGLAWQAEQAEIREILNDELDIFLRKNVHKHTTKVFRGNEKGHFTNVFLRPIPLAAHTSKAVYGLVCSGSQEQVTQYLQGFEDKSKYESIYSQARQPLDQAKPTPAGERYAFGQQLMAATTLTNLVYPVYTQRSYIKHSPPGRWWNSLYTWDSGFIGLGLAELDARRAVECLNAYTTPEGDESAFIHHGSPVPVQIFLFQELWNQTQSKELLAYFYPRLRQYHRFMAGRLGSSTTRTLRSNMLKTWDYFYNSGGWDDYPPQQYVHEQKLESTVAPVVNTVMAIRTAKILRMAAQASGHARDTVEYDQDIALFSQALQQHAWDKKSGYFGYVQHDEAGNPVKIMTTEQGVNYNMGLDGAYPLLAGICTPAQQEVLLHRIMDPGRMWTPIGISVVDQQAPYYRNDGYWNGSVWLPHQWFVWKTMLDLGRGDYAYQIAQTGLELWKKETETSYNSFEHFMVNTGRGAGWHQFSGLSTPVLSWYGAYFKPGRLTVGFDCWVTEKRFNEDHTRLEARLTVNPSTEKRSMVVSLNPGRKYRVYVNGQPLPFRLISAGVLQLDLPAGIARAQVSIQPV